MSTGFRISLSRPAIERLDVLDRGTERRVMGKLYEVAADPLADGPSWAVEGLVDLRMCRVDDVRLFFVADAQERAVYVLAIRTLDRAGRRQAS